MRVAVWCAPKVVGGVDVNMESEAMEMWRVLGLIAVFVLIFVVFPQVFFRHME